jgi:hypothetical protein
MPSPSDIFVAFDLRLLTCPEYFLRDLLALDMHFDILTQHIEAFERAHNENQNISIVLTRELKKSVLEVFPWNVDVNVTQELIDLHTFILPILNSATERLPVDQQFQIEPDISKQCSYLHQPIIQQWFDLIGSASICWSDFEHQQYLKIASLGDNDFFQILKDGTVVSLVEAFGPQLWDDMLMWANVCLPRAGDFIYVPFHGWNGHSNFPKGITTKNGRGPKDSQNRIWKWDPKHKNHWDVVDDHDVRIVRIFPDGKIFE